MSQDVGDAPAELNRSAFADNSDFSAVSPKDCFGRQAEVVINALSSFTTLKVVLSRALFRFERFNQTLGINPILPDPTNAKSYSMKIQVFATRNKLS